MTAAGLRLETPEGIDLEVIPAGPVPRGLALLVDGLITQSATLLLFVLLSLGGNAGLGLFFMLLFMIEWFYPVLFEVLRVGQTPGKRAMSLRVVSADATPIGWNASLLRNLLRAVDVFPIFYLAGVVSMLLGRRFQRLGDLAADTLVVHAQAPNAPREALSPAVLAALGARTSPIPLNAAEQRALLGYAERHTDLSVERAIELSDVLAPLSGERGEAGRAEVLRIASGIAGRP